MLQYYPNVAYFRKVIASFPLWVIRRQRFVYFYGWFEAWCSGCSCWWRSVAGLSTPTKKLLQISKKIANMLLVFFSCDSICSCAVETPYNADKIYEYNRLILFGHIHIKLHVLFFYFVNRLAMQQMFLFSLSRLYWTKI